MIYLIFFISGATALVYQVAWMKLLTVELGSTVYAVSTVLTVFMSGLALGSWGFGRRADRSSRPLLLYAGMEAALGLYALAFLAALPFVHKFYVVLERAYQPSYQTFGLIKLGLAFALLIVPTTLMGGTLPVLSRYLGMDRPSHARRLAVLYSCNTAGAVAGCLLFAFWWILLLGVSGSIVLAAGLNLLLALAALGLHRWRGPLAAGHESPTQRSEPVSVTPPDEDLGIRAALLIAFLSGFVVLACEVLWIRLMVNYLSGNALIFATVLAAVLTGLAVGGFVAAFLVGRCRRLAPIVAGSLLSGAALLAGLVLLQPALGGLFSSTLDSAVRGLPFLALFLVLLAPCTVLGITFPILIRLVSRGASTVGRDVGRLYAVNTVGAILGALVSGFLLIALLGVNASLLVLALLYALPAVLLVRGPRQRTVAAGLIIVLAIPLFLPDVRRPRYWYNGGFTRILEIPPAQTAFLEEGVSATVGVAEMGGARYLTVNGLIVAQARRQDLWDLLTKAHLPMLLHPDPRRVVLVGLGAGVSLGATESYDLDRLVCVELSPEVVRACRLFDGVNHKCLEDPRLELMVNDGRHFLATTDDRFDVINVDPIDPPVCTLYSRDFFQVCHDRLADGGLMVQWVPVFRMSPGNVQVIMRSFREVFPHSTVWYNGTAVLMVGSRGRPLEIRLDRFVDRSRDPRVERSLAQVGSPDPWLLLSMFVGDGAAIDDLFPEDIPENTDNRPYLEYTVLRTREQAQQRWVLDMLPRLASPLEAHLDRDGMVPEFATDFQRTRQLANAFFQARVLLLDGRRAEAEALIEQVRARYGPSSRELDALGSFFGLGGE